MQGKMDDAGRRRLGGWVWSEKGGVFRAAAGSPRSGRGCLAGGASPPDDALRDRKPRRGAGNPPLRRGLLRSGFRNPHPPARAHRRTPLPKIRTPPQIFFPAPQAGFRAVTTFKLHPRAHKRDLRSMGRGHPLCPTWTPSSTISSCRPSKASWILRTRRTNLTSNSGPSSRLRGYAIPTNRAARLGPLPGSPF